MDSPRFIADHNVGRLGRRLRMLGFDTAVFGGGSDIELVSQALAEGRIILTRDTHIQERRVAASGLLKVVLLASDRTDEQLCQVVKQLGLKDKLRPFTLCIEDSAALEEKTPQEVAGRVPPHVFHTQTQYMECPHCRRIYWRGTHWQAMLLKLEKVSEC
jgi:uncharacterized protein